MAQTCGLLRPKRFFFFNRHLLLNLPVTQVQLDEMWNFIARKHARETDEAGESFPNGEKKDGKLLTLRTRIVPEPNA